MSRDYFRVLVVNLATGKGKVVKMDGRDRHLGGSGLAAALFKKYGHVDKAWTEPSQPLIFTIGPLTGYFPLMSKTVCSFKSPYHDQYAESHAGGRSALSLRFAGYDGLVIIGRAPALSCLIIGSRQLELKDVHYMKGIDLQKSGKMLRKMIGGAGHRSILRIGPAGENLLPMACITVDTYRHFGRLGGGAVMGAKNLKAVAILGDGIFDLPEGKTYRNLFEAVYQQLTTTDMMDKYHNLGTPVNVAILNGLKALPIRNLQQTTDPDIEGISGETFANDTLLRNTACAGCPVGCIHIGFVREKFMEPNQYLYRQISYDHEPIFATGSMLGMTNAFKVLAIIDMVEKMGLDVMSAGVALAWATEALARGVISEKETLVPLKFGDADGYKEAILHLGSMSNDFYRLLGQGTMKAVEHYGGEDFACVLGQEMAGYATGEVFFTSQALGFRHSHLDAGGYSYDQKQKDKDPQKAVEFLLKDEQGRVLLTSMVSCLFAREIYKEQLLAECLNCLGYRYLADNMNEVAQHIQKMRWQLRLASGFDPRGVKIPKRFKEIITWKGEIDENYLNTLQKEYGKRIVELGRAEED
ncbi:MAG: aldehyde ferredoxin oxidoreductase [Deltaproteobacteria bacterium]|nr:aldehyde ferredoxin oxidoreductase [Deltaproteobacteria bacterium]MBW2070834.1 aldehyde ferredoxin oxidoreductase [Deltaproteobacteria bacterium]